MPLLVAKVLTSMAPLSPSKAMASLKKVGFTWIVTLKCVFLSSSLHVLLTEIQSEIATCNKNPPCECCLKYQKTTQYEITWHEAD